MIRVNSTLINFVNRTLYSSYLGGEYEVIGERQVNDIWLRIATHISTVEPHLRRGNTKA